MIVQTLNSVFKNGYHHSNGDEKGIICDSTELARAWFEGLYLANKREQWEKDHSHYIMKFQKKLMLMLLGYKYSYITLT